MPRGKSSGRANDERRWLFSLHLLNPEQLRIYAWTKKFPRKSGVLSHKIRELILAELDATGFTLSDEEAQRILVEEGFADAVPTRPARSRNEVSPSLSASKRKDDDDDIVTM